EAEAWNALGEHDKALAAAQRSIEVAETNEDRYEHAVAHRPLGVAHSMLGNKEAAEAAFRQGIEEIRIVGDPFELAKTLVEMARHLREWDPSTLDLGAAAEHLREARQLIEKLGVEKWMRRVDEDIHEIIRLAESTTEATSAIDGSAVRAGTAPAVERGGIQKFRSVTIISRAPEVRDILEKIARVAPSNLPVLITGESGTGKELFARALQELSGRPPDRFVAVNCAALPKELHESELFGHARGSFTGSTSEKAGLFELADGGTIFLDEIGDLDPGAQGKLLRVLENGELRRVGELKPRRVDARVVAATNRDLVQGAREGFFRGDLFHRLNGLPVRVPSLRERPSDIEPLVHHFLEFYQTQYKRRVHLPADLLELYQRYRWPGNVRELRQEIHRMVLLTADGTPLRIADSEVARLSVGDEVTALAEASGLASAVGEHERRLILDALHRSGGNKAQAARLLNMSRTTLIGKIQRLGIE
ncbi:MAG TPA: sigma 54-interacting transcriptional regulator, partial [Candidatus Udaeobacter sp.]|nr:sigma 54-interacting transcriptional regulator [Candidatus Udaeobacter sp.]